MRNTITCPPGYTIIGTCSLCGGPVTTPTAWMATIPAPRTCARCGAVSAEYHGPVIPMMPAPPTKIEIMSTLPAISR